MNSLDGVSQGLLEVISDIEVIKLHVDMVRWVSLLYAIYLRDILQILKTH